MTPQEPHGLTTSASEPVERTPGRLEGLEALRNDSVRAWTIILPWSEPPVKPNGGHGNRYEHAKKVKAARQAMGLLARNARIPWLGRCEVRLTWYVADRIKRDADNLAWTLKPLCDALAGKKPLDHRIVDDDTPDLMVKHMPVIVYRPGEPKQMVLTITEL